MKQLLIEPNPNKVGFYRAIFNGEPPQLISALHGTVGTYTAAGIWNVPFDQLKRITDAAHACGYFYSVEGLILYQNEDQTKERAYDKLHPYQVKGVDRITKQRRLMVNFKPGLGKTATAIRAMWANGVSRALIVCPAIVRDTWAEQFSIWWPKALHEVQLIETGKEAREAKAPFVVTSYELLPQVAWQEWDAVILDECHYVKNDNSKRSKTIRNLSHWRKLSKDSLRIFLTGTPIANEPIDLHNQVDLLYPDLWGNVHEFKRRYCSSMDSAYAYSGRTYFGLNILHAAELKERLDQVSITATEKEVEGLLPPVNFSIIRIKPDRRFNLREYLDNFTRRDPHNSRGVEHAIRACGAVKVDKAVELARHDLASGSTHVSIMTHLQDTAEEIAAALQGEGVPVACVHGGNASHKKRHSEIARLAKAKKAIFVGTMHCIGIGINELKDFPDVIYAEWDYRPDEVVQSMKRYQRIGGKSNVRIRGLVLEGTLEERVAKIVARKLQDQKMISDVGTMVSDLHDALSPQMTDEEFYKHMQEAAARMGERDEYT